MLIDGSVKVRADADQLSQVFLNLVNNALQAMEEGGKLTLGGEEGGGEGEWVAAFVKDTGPGIAPEDIEHLFQAFYTTKEDGTGLGLSMCKGIIEEHGGEIRVDSVVGEGTCFSIVLPAEGKA